MNGLVVDVERGDQCNEGDRLPSTLPRFISTSPSLLGR